MYYWTAHKSQYHRKRLFAFKRLSQIFSIGIIQPSQQLIKFSNFKEAIFQPLRDVRTQFLVSLKQLYSKKGHWFPRFICSVICDVHIMNTDRTKFAQFYAWFAHICNIRHFKTIHIYPLNSLGLQNNRRTLFTSIYIWSF